MTFNPAAWAVDGATINSELARVATYAACPDQGIVQSGDLSVIQMSTPGNSVWIQRGSALILNGYMNGDPGGVDQMYAVTNRATASVPTADMPASNPAAKSYILAVVIGDAEYSQAGHPWMGADDPAPGEEDTFVYVRPTMIECAPGATSLSVNYPALPLARIDIPANTTTITNAMIHDLRNLAHPRTQLVQDYVTAAPDGSIISGFGSRIGGTVLTVKVPSWATQAKIQGFVEGLHLAKLGSANLAVRRESDNVATALTNIEETAGGAVGDRRSYNVGGVINVVANRGTTQKFSIYAVAADAPSAGMLTWTSSTGLFVSVYFEEQPV